MKKTISRTVAGCLLASVVVAPAAADDRVVRGLMGLGGAIILNEMQRNNQPPPRRQQYIGSAQAAKAAEARELRREVQRRLNLLGFDAGVADGVYGRRTRTAIARFQASIGRNPDGRISAEEISILYARTGGGGTGDGFAAGGGVAVGPAPAFPSLSGQAAPGASASAGGFPALGANGSAGQQPSGFPALGGTAPAAQGGAPSAFPQLGTSDTAKAAPGGGFPQLGSAQPQGGSGTTFPTIAAPSGGAETPPPQMPGLAAAPEQAERQMPGLAAAPEPKEGEQPMPGLSAAPVTGSTQLPALAAPAPETGRPARPADLGAEIAKVVYETPDKQPLISGITLAMSGGSLEQTVADNGFSGCENGGGRFSCAREADTLTETIRAWIHDGDVWAVQREIVFKSPVPRPAVAGQLSGAYPHLASGQGIISSGAYCNIRDSGDAALARLFDERPVSGKLSADAFADGPLARMSDLAERCPVAYTLDLEGTGNEVSAIRMTFFDGTGINREYAAALAREDAETKALEEKVVNDLKL
jgi:hypothetical protein